jgi:hypothetical protein
MSGASLMRAALSLNLSLADMTGVLAGGIARMAVWVRERRPMTPVEFSNIEVRKNLPASRAVTAK